ncbi:MAG TPA: carboxypeptidase regulatory-like domain-containing protein [Syntrophales bacterium]|nr:carboxypeptidase regulatory-like domain-containing protein [Syntrophales bacterium]
MADYSKAKRTEYFAIILGLLLSALIMIILSGCGSSPTNSISGRITSGGSALPGVTVTLAGSASMVTTTDTNGKYNFNDVSSGTFTVTPSLTGYVFSPLNRNVWLEGIDAIGFNFSAAGKGRVGATTHTLYLKNDGTVWAWGNNSNGQLGNGTMTQSATPVQISGLSSVVAVAAGYAHTVALKSDGTVWAWGNNSNGQLGNGTTTDSGIPVQITGLSGAAAIAAGYAHTVALMTDGTVWTWGNNSNGQLGDGTTTDSHIPLPTWLPGVAAIAAGHSHTVALMNDITNVSVWAWGNNSNGQLGNGTTTDSAAPVHVSNLSGGTAIAAGSYHTVALKDDGTVWVWGSNIKGQLGNGSTTQSTVPVQISGLPSVTAVAAGYTHTVALKSDGTVWAWGDNFYGQLGDGTTIDRWTPVQAQ